MGTRGNVGQKNNTLQLTKQAKLKPSTSANAMPLSQKKKVCHGEKPQYSVSALINEQLVVLIIGINWRHSSLWEKDASVDAMLEPQQVVAIAPRIPHRQHRHQPLSAAATNVPNTYLTDRLRLSCQQEAGVMAASVVGTPQACSHSGAR